MGSLSKIFGYNNKFLAAKTALVLNYKQNTHVIDKKFSVNMKQSEV